MSTQLFLKVVIRSGGQEIVTFWLPKDWRDLFLSELPIMEVGSHDCRPKEPAD